jgi:ribosome-associated translation inhibitor RaiA
MVNEVEDILHEIRERVRAEEEKRALAAPAAPSTMGSFGAQNSESRSDGTRVFERVSAHLTTTARSWDKLPPLFSNRSGTAARLELWIKARFKSLTRWFTWEQVNFNSAVHHALSETLQALAAYADELKRMRAEVAKEAEDRRADFERRDQEINARLTEINARISGLAGEMRDEQRVCFKQLSLEAGEAAVLADRARRAVESRLEKLEKTLSSKKKAP